MPNSLRLAPAQLADIAEAALRLGLQEHAEHFLTAAYRAANGETQENLQRLLLDLRLRASNAEYAIFLTKRQKDLISPILMHKF